MHRFGVQKYINHHKRVVTYVVCGLFLILADVLFWAQMAWAAPVYTPYANSVAGQSGLGAGTAGNAVGAPDGQTVSLLGLNSSLTLDMGEGEEGTSSLKIYFGPLNLHAGVAIDFLDDSQAVIKTEQRQLFLDLGPSEQTFAYDWQAHDRPYRFVRITSTASLALNVDSVEAFGFIGSSAGQDTDGDGTPDREDSNPLTPDQPQGGGGSGSGSGGSGGTTTHTIVRTTQSTTSSGAGSTPTVNEPASPENDKDGDQMDDAWEAAHGLDPDNKADALEDPDKDGLTNVKEYQFDTNPRDPDTDNDGITDGWEVTHGLNAKVNDANEDPDFDYVTNRGEAFMDTNPYVADSFASLANKLDGRPRMMTLILWVLLLILALLAWWRIHKLVAALARRTRQGRSGKRKSPAKSSLPPR